MILSFTLSLQQHIKAKWVVKEWRIFFKPQVSKSNEEVNTNSNVAWVDQTWLRSTMGPKRYNCFPVLNPHTDIVDNLSPIEVAERFANAKERSRNEFGTFTEKDLH